VGLTVLGIVEIIVFIVGLTTDNFSLAASIFIATLSCLVGLVVFIYGAIIIRKLKKELVNGKWDPCSLAVLIIVASILS
jgi:hypothetical protein